ncbi:hypothetical protein LCGC14_2297680 [marine sediment metagenome]|uniref:Uncharacterized protein n=1 Tax=marine sediment metagenome TaxID=412755 RepID=A0A0F9F1T5_9ZZZZ
MRFPDYLAYTPKGQGNIGRLVAHVFCPTTLKMTKDLVTDSDGKVSVLADISMGEHHQVRSFTRFGLKYKVRRLVARRAA